MSSTTRISNHSSVARVLLAVATAILLAVAFTIVQPTAQAQSTSAAKLRFEISFPASVHAGPVTGRIFVMISRTAEREPRLQVGRTGAPMFGRDIEQLKPGQAGIVDQTDLGTPVENMEDIPPGEYFVQGLINVYSEFKRAYGHVVWMHDDQWEGQQWNVSPGNLYSQVQKVKIDPKVGGVIKLVADQKIPPVEVPADTKWVKRFKFQSPMLTKFWGRPIYLGAVVLLPRDYDTSTLSYPVIYEQGHFSLRPALRFEEGKDLYQEWVKDDFPRMIAVTFQHPNPYFDDSYAVNSVNVGPYGDAIMQELIPEVENRFRVLKEPYARVLTGGSTGGWEALALQIFHPDFFGGTWAYCPDPVTFTNVEGINIYEDQNAFYKEYGWRTAPTINSRETDGRVRQTSEQRNHMELVNGTKGRSGHQLDIWSAVYGPIGQDGYFEPAFDKLTGKMNPEAGKYWRENYDLLHYLRRNWSTVGPKLIDKLHVYTGDMDTYYLNVSTQELEEWMKTTQDPHYKGFFLYGDGKPHCWSGPGTTAERVKEIAQYIMWKKPEGATTPWWEY